MKILVIGNKGMLGSALCNELLKQNMNFTGWDKEEIDITKRKDISSKIDNSFTHIINCAAYTDVDGAERNRELCDSINIRGVINLVDRCKELDIIFLSISTDYVFDGKQESYNEDSIKKPLNYYGLSKAKGEEYIGCMMEKYYIIRTSWLFGRNGDNFVKTILKLSHDNKEVKVVNDQYGSPTYTIDLSNAIIKLINNKKNYGIYHLTNSGSCTWFDFTKEIIGNKCDIIPCSSAEFPRDAKRPKFSILNNNKTELLPHWNNALERYLIDREN
jgi:dTDP-4-dehydrorhamnose reductase